MSGEDPNRFRRAAEAVDDFNRKDPRRRTEDGEAVPLELWYARRLTEWVLRLDPGASEALRLAARAQHIGRWTVPRERYPEGRGGYLRWREDLKKYHAETAGGLLAAAGYDAAFMERVRSLILKKDIRGDRDTQTLEDALCLVFLETQFAELKDKTPDDKMREIVRKTWKKMGPQGQKAALGLPLAAPLKTFLKETLG